MHSFSHLPQARHLRAFFSILKRIFATELLRAFSRKLFKVPFELMEGRDKKRHRVEVIVKVGGAAITNKAVRETFKEDVAASIALMFKELHQQKFRAILIHGAGTLIKQNSFAMSIALNI